MNIYWACVSLVLAVALSRGGRPEQVAALVLVVASGMSLSAAPDPTTSFRSFEWVLFAIDVLSFASFTALSLTANRYWPMCVAGMKLIPIAGHLAKVAQPSISPFTYAWLTGAWTYPYMIVIVIGVARHQLRVQRYGNDQPWRSRSR